MTPMNSKSGSSPTLEDTGSKILELNEMLIRLVKEAGQTFLDSYEKVSQSLLDFEKAAAGRSQLDWVGALADTQVKFVQDVTNAYLELALGALK